MFLSAIGYLITLFMAFTIIPLIAFLLRILLVMICTRIYWMFAREKSPVQTLQLSMKLAHPVGFITAIFHGYTSLWMGVVLLTGMSVKVDVFLGLLLAFSFLWFGLKRINNPAEIQVNNSNKLTTKDGNPNTIVLNPEVESTPDDGSNPMEDIGKNVQDQLKSRASEFMQGNTVIGLIGKLTGVALATMSLIPLG